MAQPIPLVLPTRDPRQELFSRLQNAPAEHAEALLSAYELLQGLHDRGVLDVLRGALGSGDKIVEEVVQVTNSPESIRAIRNFVIMFKTLGEIDPEALSCFAGAFPKALSEANVCEKEPPGLFKLLNEFRSKNLRRGLAIVNAFLEGFGKGVSSEKSPEGGGHEQK